MRDALCGMAIVLCLMLAATIPYIADDIDSIAKSLAIIAEKKEAGHE